MIKQREVSGMCRFICLLMLLLIMTSTTFAEEKDFVDIDGITYYHGDPGFPVWSMGNRVGAVADLSSAYIVEEDEKWRLIGFLSFPVVLREQGETEGAIPWFWQKLKTGEFFFNRDGRAGNKVEGQAFLRELTAYQMLLDAAEANMR